MDLLTSSYLLLYIIISIRSFMRLQNWQIKKLKYDDNAYFTHHQTSLLQNLSKFNFLLFILYDLALAGCQCDQMLE